MDFLPQSDQPIKYIPDSPLQVETALVQLNTHMSQYTSFFYLLVYLFGIIVMVVKMSVRSAPDRAYLLPQLQAPAYWLSGAAEDGQWPPFDRVWSVTSLGIGLLVFMQK